MDFNFSDEHKMVREMVREFARKEIAPHIGDWDRAGHFERSTVEKMGETGILGLCFPEKYGGGGLDYISMVIAAEEIEYAETSFREYISVHTALTGLGILQWGDQKQKKAFLTPIASGSKLAAFGLTEPNAGSDVAALETTARRSGEEYELNGAKAWITLGDNCDLVLVFAKTDTDAGHRGISAFIVDAASPGVHGEAIKGKMGVRAGSTGMMTFDGVKVPAPNLLGQEGEGFRIAMSCLDNGRLTVAAGACGLIRACIDASVKYARERETFGRPIGQHQLVQQLIAHMVSGYEAAFLLTYRAAWLKNQGRRNTKETALAKWFATEAAWRAADNAVQVHGAYGFSNEYPVERFLRNARGATIYEGTSQIQEIMQAEYALGYREDRPLRCELPSWPFADEV
ncbi:MAG: acyl-CoA dehydrogenase family protein [Thermaerobacterales bacterium]